MNIARLLSRFENATQRGITKILTDSRQIDATACQPRRYLEVTDQDDDGGSEAPARRRRQQVDREEFTTFYTATFHRLVGQLYAMTGDRAEAQDAVQEAFVRAWARRTRFDRDGAPESWIRVTAWRIAVTRWRRTKKGSA